MHVEKEMSDNIEIIMNLRNRNEDIQHDPPESHPCNECGVNNVWDLSFSTFVDHLDEHRGRKTYSESHTREDENYSSPNFIEPTTSFTHL